MCDHVRLTILSSRVDRTYSAATPLILSRSCAIQSGGESAVWLGLHGIVRLFRRGVIGHAVAIKNVPGRCDTQLAGSRTKPYISPM